MPKIALVERPALCKAQRWFLLAGLLLAPGSFTGHAQQENPQAYNKLIYNPGRRSLEDSGVSPFSVLTTEIWGNVSGGLEQRGWWNSLLEFGFELDTARMGLWENGLVMIEGHWVSNSRKNVSFQDYTGSFNPVSSIAASDHVRVYNLHYKQSWREGKWEIKAGQVATDDDFMMSDYAAMFINSAFGAMPSQVGTPLASSTGGYGGFPIYSVAAPGVVAAVRPVEPWVLQLGVYHGTPGPDTSDNYGFAWADESPAEMALLLESGHSYMLGTRPATTKVGLSYHTGEVDDFNSTNPESSLGVEQSPGLYVIQDVAAVVDDEGNTKLGLFGRVGAPSRHSRSVVKFYVDGGVNWFAPIRGRDDDTFLLGVSHTNFDGDYQRSTGEPGIANAETTIELGYHARVAGWMHIHGNVQWLFNPEADPDSLERETATVLGLRVEISF